MTVLLGESVQKFGGFGMICQGHCEVSWRGELRKGEKNFSLYKRLIGQDF